MILNTRVPWSLGNHIIFFSINLLLNYFLKIYLMSVFPFPVVKSDIIFKTLCISTYNPFQKGKYALQKNTGSIDSCVILSKAA